MSWVEILGYAASAAVFATFCMRGMIPLRSVALASNVLFVAYGAVNHIYPVLVLHTVLIPINAIRLLQMQRLVRHVRAAQTEALSIHSLLPFMHLREFAAGATIVRKDEVADRLYYLAEGTVEIPEFGKVIGPGTVVGEIGVFSPHRQRIASAICRTDCQVYELSESDAKQLYFQDRSFGFAVLQLMITRLIEDSRANPAVTRPSAVSDPV
jgi:CRP/FNR family transcriptional regulator, cyclic AMP receptor protein